MAASSAAAAELGPTSNCARENQLVYLYDLVRAARDLALALTELLLQALRSSWMMEESLGGLRFLAHDPRLSSPMSDLHSNLAPSCPQPSPVRNEGSKMFAA